jgi:hypothetical protein
LYRVFFNLDVGAIQKAELLSKFGQLGVAAGQMTGHAIRELSKFNKCYTYRVAQKSLDNRSVK